MTSSEQQPGDGGQDASSAAGESSLRPLTSSVLAALAGRGVDLPGVTRPSGEGGGGGNGTSGVGSTGTSGSGNGGPDAPRYTVLEQVARGGMGVVMRVRDEDLRRDLAMKVLDRGGREPDSLGSAPREIGRFLEEAQVTGQLDHPGVPPIHELGLDRDGRLFFTMKLVRGGTFADVISHVRAGTEGWTVTRALGVVLKVCEALAYAHHKGVIHRDIKPANLMVGRFGETYVMDWGLAKVFHGGGGVGSGSDAGYDELVSRSIVHTDRREAVGDAGSSHATLDGDAIGTPAYMSPEQARGDLEALGPHSDIYAVGALLYHLLAGQPPYLEPGLRVSPHSVLRWVIDGPPKPLAELAPDAPAELVAVIDKAMAREPGLRYATMLDLAGDLQAFIEDRVVRAYQSGAWAEARKWVTRNKPLAAAAGLLLLVTVGALGGISWVQSSGRAAVEERNQLLGQSNAALEDANDQLGQANTELALTNTRLADTNAALDQQRTEAERARAAAERAREQALANAELAEANEREAEANALQAEANERRARVESYAANMTAAVAALESGAGAAARRHLAACPEDLRGWDWRHLSLRADPSLHVWSGADSLVHDVDQSPDGTLLATASGPFGDYGAPFRETRIMDAVTGETLHSLPSEFTVRQVEFSPDGTLLAYATNQHVLLWDLVLERPRGSRHWLGEGCWDLEFLDDERLLVLSVDEGNDLSRLDVWNLRTDQVEFSRASSPAMTAAAALPDGSGVVFGRSDQSLERWDLPGGEARWQLPGVQDPEEAGLGLLGLPGPTGIAFDALGERLVVTDRDGTVRLLDARDGRELARHELAQATPRSPVFHPDGPWVVIADSSGSLRFLDADSLLQIERLSGHDRVVTSLSISADGDRLVSAGQLGDLRVWDGRPGAASLVIESRAATGDLGRASGNRSLAFSPDGRLLAWMASPKVVLLTDTLTGEVRFRLAEADSAVAALQFTPDGERLLVETEAEGLLTFSVSDGALLARVPSGGYSDWAAFDPTGSLMASVATRTDRRIDLRVVESGEWVASLVGHEDYVTHGRFSADSQRLVTCDFGGTLRVWDLRTGEALQVIQSDSTFYQLELIDGDRGAVTTTYDPTRSAMSVWDLETGELRARHPARGLTLRGDMHPGGSLWAGTRAKPAVSLFDRERGEMFSLPAAAHAVTHVLFDPSGTRLAGLDRSGRLILWDTVHPRDRSVERRAAARLSRRAGEARALVADLVERHLLMERVISALEADDSLDADLRDAAVREARVRGDDGPWVVKRLWERLLPAHLSAAELPDSPETAAAAAALLATADQTRARWEGFSEAWEPWLWALFMQGRLDEADALFPTWRDTGYSFNPNGPLAGQAVWALVSAARGDEPLAREQLAKAREEYERGQRDAPSDVNDLALTARLIAAAEARLGDG